MAGSLSEVGGRRILVGRELQWLAHAGMLLGGGRWRLIKNVYHNPSKLCTYTQESGGWHTSAGEDGGSWYTQEDGG